MLIFRQFLHVDTLVHQEQLCQLPDSLPLQAQAHILPVSVDHLFIYVLVRDVYTAGVTDLTVNDGDLRRLRLLNSESALPFSFSLWNEKAFCSASSAETTLNFR